MTKYLTVLFVAAITTIASAETFQTVRIISLTGGTNGLAWVDTQGNIHKLNTTNITASFVLTNLDYDVNGNSKQITNLNQITFDEGGFINSTVFQLNNGGYFDGANLVSPSGVDLGLFSGSGMLYVNASMDMQGNDIQNIREIGAQAGNSMAIQFYTGDGLDINNGYSLAPNINLTSTGGGFYFNSDTGILSTFTSTDTGNQWLARFQGSKSDGSSGFLVGQGAFHEGTIEYWDNVVQADKFFGFAIGGEIMSLKIFGEYKVRVNSSAEDGSNAGFQVGADNGGFGDISCYGAYWANDGVGITRGATGIYVLDADGVTTHQVIGGIVVP